MKLLRGHGEAHVRRGGDGPVVQGEPTIAGGVEPGYLL
jgi:hypothetical protein